MLSIEPNYCFIEGLVVEDNLVIATDFKEPYRTSQKTISGCRSPDDRNGVH